MCCFFHGIEEQRKKKEDYALFVLGNCSNIQILFGSFAFCIWKSVTNTKMHSFSNNILGARCKFGSINFFFCDIIFNKYDDVLFLFSTDKRIKIK